MSEDELIAFVKYPLPEKIFEGSISNEWIPLSGKLGEHKEGQLNIQLLFIPNENRRTTENSASLSPTNNNSTMTNSNNTNILPANSLSNASIQPSNQVQLPLGTDISIDCVIHFISIRSFYFLKMNRELTKCPRSILILI